MEIEKLTLQGVGAWNEDALIVQEEGGVFGVLDGATSLVPFRGPGGETGGYLAAIRVKSHLERYLGEAGEKCSLKDAVLAANADLRQAMLDCGVDAANPHQMWSAGIAIVRVTEHRVEYAQAGDCMIAALYADGEVRLLTRDQIDFLDSQTRRRWQEYAASGAATKEQRWELEAPRILDNKQWMNAPDGYGVLNGQPELANCLEYGSINRNRLTGLLLLTDGLFPLSEAYDASVDFSALARDVEQQGLQGYADALLALERSDPDGDRYPRIKTSDDKTAIWIRF